MCGVWLGPWPRPLARVLLLWGQVEDVSFGHTAAVWPFGVDTGPHRIQLFVPFPLHSLHNGLFKGNDHFPGHQSLGLATGLEYWLQKPPKHDRDIFKQTRPLEILHKLSHNVIMCLHVGKAKTMCLLSLNHTIFLFMINETNYEEQ